MHTIECVGRDGIKRLFVFDDPYQCATLNGHVRYCFSVKTQIDDVHFFELDLQEKDDGDLQIVSILHHYRPEYAAMGIPEALLPCVSMLLGARICSSRTWGDGEITQEFRTPEATKMWNRLVSIGLAAYSSDEDVYRTEPIDAGTQG